MDRPSKIEEALAQMHTGQWYGWTDSKNKIYSNLKLSDKVGVDGNIVDNPITELPTEEAVNCKQIGIITMSDLCEMKPCEVCGADNCQGCDECESCGA